jgi:hypothetical protein
MASRSCWCGSSGARPSLEEKCESPSNVTFLFSSPSSSSLVAFSCAALPLKNPDLPLARAASFRTARDGNDRLRCCIAPKVVERWPQASVPFCCCLPGSTRTNGCLGDL